MHGEHQGRALGLSEEQGSSPYARGAHCMGRAPHSRAGIIPVCTGITHDAESVGQCLRDHPRMHGEHLSGGEAIMRPEGSSPYARGAQGC